jgi:hypothetical protein
MALKGDRYVVVSDISYFMDQVATRGGVVVLKTAGSGAALDQSEAEVEYAASPSGEYAVGLLLCDMVDKDLTQTHLNFHKDEQQKGSKVSLMREGWVVTNMLMSGVTPAGGNKAYLGLSGLLTTATTGPGGYSYLEVGRFESSKDEDSYVKVYVKLPK